MLPTSETFQHKIEQDNKKTMNAAEHQQADCRLSEVDKWEMEIEKCVR